MTGATAVTIGGIAATNVTVVNATTITAITAAGGTAGTASVLVTTSGGINAANTEFIRTTPTPTPTPTPSISAVVPPQNMGVLYGYNQSLPKYDVRVYWDSSSNPKFAEYEVAYRVSGAPDWISKILRAKHYTYLDSPFPPMYSFDCLSNGMLYKKQLDPGTNYEFRVRSWFYSEVQPTVV